MGILLSIVLFVFGILQIILFFKIWGMTNDIEKIREIIQWTYNKEEHKRINNIEPSPIINSNKKQIRTDIELYSWVKEIKSNQEFQVMEIVDENTFVCCNANNPDGIKLKRIDIEVID